jgi:PTS system nitrogen regulatory IIA component
MMTMSEQGSVRKLGNTIPMKVTEFLCPGDAVIDLRARDKARLLSELCNRAAATLKLDAAHLSAEILKREDLGSTAMGGGVAIPHARVEHLAKPFGILARLRKPIDFDAIDDQPVDLVFLLLLPISAPAEQLSALATVARRLRDPSTVRELRRAADNAGLYAVFVRDDNP